MALILQSFADVYRLYSNKCREEHRSPLCRQVVRKIFDELNLAIFMPKKDQCDVCVSHSAGNISETEWLEHQGKKEMARLAKIKDKEVALQSSDVCVCTMDLQSVLLSPSLKASALYYKTKLCVHNFTVYNLGNKDAHNYVWHEGEGGLTANEFASCVVDFLSSNPGYKRFVLFSDGCTYQNRNAVLSKALLHFAMSNNVIIEQKILERGHTQMECDSVHSCIERKLRNTQIYVPADYVRIIKSARSAPDAYKVKYVQHHFLKDFHDTFNLNSIRPGRKVGDPVVTNLRALVYTPEGKILYKLSHDDNVEYQPLPQGRNQPASLSILQEPMPLYSSSRKIKREKFQHLQELKTVMPVDYHTFYDGLSVAV